MERAKVLIDEQNFLEAQEILNSELQSNSRNVEGLLLRSKLYTRTSRLDAALKDAEMAVIASNGSPESQLRRAICLWRLKRNGEAKDLVQYFGKGQEADTWKQMIAHHEGPNISVPRIPSIPQTTTTNPLEKPPRLDWYQTPQSVHVVLYRKGLDPNTTNIEIMSKKLKVESGEFQWSLQLGSEIDASASQYDLSAFKVEFILRKLTNVSWSSLEAPVSENTREKEQSLAQQQQQPSEQRPVLTTSYKKWESIDEDDDIAEESDPMAFFQNLYKDAPPETQRAMMKSYIESNGTALSTNWDEVSKGRVETHPPKDMEARKWD